MLVTHLLAVRAPGLIPALLAAPGSAAAAGDGVSAMPPVPLPVTLVFVAAWTGFCVASVRRAWPRPGDERMAAVWRRRVTRVGVPAWVSASVMQVTAATGVTLRTAFVTPAFYALVGWLLFLTFPVLLWGGWLLVRIHLWLFPDVSSRR
jgi:hypothetical protein